VYQRLRTIDTLPGWKSPMRYLDTIVGQGLGQIETRGFEAPDPTISPGTAENVVTAPDRNHPA
jgi:hypothetical protein